MSYETLPRRRFLGQALASLPALGYLGIDQVPPGPAPSPARPRRWS